MIRDPVATDQSRRTLLKNVGRGVLGLGLQGSLSGCTSLADGPPGVGIFLGNEEKLEPWENWFARKVDYYSVALFHDSWQDYQTRNWPLEVPLETLFEDRRLVLSFKMFPKGGRLAAVANGAYDHRYRQLAEELVANDLSDAVLRVGWELNGRWTIDTAVGRPDMYVSAWRRIVSAMRGVKDAEFDFVWAPNVWRYHLDPTKAYPGDRWVDAVGLTVYDKGDHYPFPEDCDETCVRSRRQATWQTIVEGRDAGFGLDYWAEFARTHDQPLVFPEYSIGAVNWKNPGGGDNPFFFRWFHDWIMENEDVVGWHNVWSWTRGPHYVGPPRLKGDSRFPPAPDASRAFKNLFGGDQP